MNLTITLWDGKTRLPVKCLARHGGLAVTQGVADGTGFTITHVPSGAAVIRGIRSLPAARHTMRRLHPLTDWGQPMWRLRRLKRVERAVLKLGVEARRGA